MMPLVKFVGPTDPRWLSTLDRIQQELAHDTLVKRYRPKTQPPTASPGTKAASTCALSGSWNA